MGSRQIIEVKLSVQCINGLVYLFFFVLMAYQPSWVIKHWNHRCKRAAVVIWDQGSIPGRVIPKTQKMQLDATLLYTQHYKVGITGKVEQSMEWSISVVAIQRGAFGSPSTKVANFTYLDITYAWFTYNSREILHGEVVNVLDCNNIVSKFQLQSCYYVHYRSNIFGGVVGWSSRINKPCL